MNAGSTRIFPERAGTGCPVAPHPMAWAPSASGAALDQIAADAVMLAAAAPRVKALADMAQLAMETDGGTADEVLSAVALMVAKIGQGASPHTRLTFDTLRVIQERHLIALGLGFDLAAAGPSGLPPSQPDSV